MGRPEEWSQYPPSHKQPGCTSEQKTSLVSQAQHRRHDVRRRGQERRSRRGPLCGGAEGQEEERRGILSLLFSSEHLHAAMSTMPDSDSSGCDGPSVKVYAPSTHHCRITMSLSPHFFVKIFVKLLKCRWWQVTLNLAGQGCGVC